MMFDCFTVPNGTIAIDASRNVTDAYDKVARSLDTATTAYEAGNSARALRWYRDAAAIIVSNPKRFRSSYEADALLHVARALAQLGDAAGARTLWRRYVSSQPNPYEKQADRLRSLDARAFFRAMAADATHFTSGHPDDANAQAALAQGAAAGARGDLGAAVRFFNSAQAQYTTSYVYFADGAAAWLRGDRKAARKEWLCGSDAGTSLPPGDIGFHPDGTLASVTMLLSL